MSEPVAEAPLGESNPPTEPDDEPVEPSEGAPDPSEPTEGAPGEPTPEDEAAEQEAHDAENAAPPEPAMSEAEAEKRMKSLDREATRHANRVSEIMGELGQDLLPCPRCLPMAPGFIYPPEAAPLPPDQVAAVLHSIGQAPAEDFEKANNSRMCDGCKGKGKRLSGSLVPDQRALICSDCSGRGWIGVGGADLAAVPPLPNGDGEPLPAPVVAGEDKPALDPWGRTPDDVDYGRMPQYTRT